MSMTTTLLSDNELVMNHSRHYLVQCCFSLFLFFGIIVAWYVCRAFLVVFDIK